MNLNTTLKKFIKKHKNNKNQVIFHSSSCKNNTAIENIINNKQAIYDLTVDKTVNKIGDGKKLEKYPLQKLPKFLQTNIENYKEWID